MKIWCFTLATCLLSFFNHPTKSHSDTLPWAEPGAVYTIRNGLNTGLCTVGWPATDNTHAHYFLTAGHCFRYDETFFMNPHPLNTQVYNPDSYTPIGYEHMWQTVTVSNTYLDYSVVELYPGQKLNSSGWGGIPANIYESPTTIDTLCLAARFNSSSERCGKYLSTGETVVNHVTYPQVYEATICALPGDSGGPVYNIRKGAVGILVLGSPVTCWAGIIPITLILDSIHKVNPSFVLI